MTGEYGYDNGAYMWSSMVQIVRSG